MTKDEAEKKKQDEFDGVLSALSTYSTKRKEYIEVKNKVLNNAKNFCKGREKIIEEFKNGIFSWSYDEEEEQEARDREEENNIKNESRLNDHKKFNRLNNLKER